ncbi:DMT family transporter [Dinoroseobacter sp. S76]|uniref:DMT family transporter n=1 Tax=Dinoroseobacter sp. S76 TaxID=3415124 RepID=UPI003C7B341A
MPRFIRQAPPTALILAIGLLVGVSFTLSKIVAMAAAPPLLALFWQVAVASAALSAVLIAQRQRPSVAPRVVVYYLGAGVLGVTLPALIGYAVLGHVSAGFYASLVTLSPLFTFAFSAGLERRMLPLHRLAGILLGLFGISLATLRGFDFAGVAPIWIGLALCGPAVLAAGNVFRSRAYPAGADPMGLAAGTLLLQTLLIGIGLLGFGDPGASAALAPPVFAAIAGIGGITAVSYALTFEVQRRTDGVGFSQVGYFATLSGIGFGALVFGERISPVLVLSLGLLFLGVAITNGHLRLPRVRGRLKAFLQG